MFAFFAFWFTSCVGLRNPEATVKVDALVNSFNEFTGEVINRRLMTDYLKVYNVEVEDGTAKGVTLYD